MAVAFIATASAFAQRASYTGSSFFSTSKSEESITYGIRAGMNVSSVNLENTTSSIGYNVGVSLDMPIFESLYVQSGAYFTMKGGKNKYDNDKKLTTHYLEIPVLASYRYNISDNTQIQLNFGPYFAFGLTGKYKNHGSEWECFDDNELKRFDMGLQLGTGVTIKKFYLGLGYDFGLTNISQDSSDNMKNGNFFIQAGYNF